MSEVRAGLEERGVNAHVPVVEMDLTSSTVMVMEFIDGFKPTDMGMLKGDKAKGLHPVDVRNLFKYSNMHLCKKEECKYASYVV